MTVPQHFVNDLGDKYFENRFKSPWFKRWRDK